jgi:YggT family protein
MIYSIVSFLFFLIEIAILIRVFLSWLPVPKEHRLIDLLYQVTEPVLAPIRNLIQRSPFGANTMFDFSPIVAFLLIGLIRSIVLGLLR